MANINNLSAQGRHLLQSHMAALSAALTRTERREILITSIKGIQYSPAETMQTGSSQPPRRTLAAQFELADTVGATVCEEQGLQVGSDITIIQNQQNAPTGYVRQQISLWSQKAGVDQGSISEAWIDNQKKLDETEQQAQKAKIAELEADNKAKKIALDEAEKDVQNVKTQIAAYEARLKTLTLLPRRGSAQGSLKSTTPEPQDAVTPVTDGAAKDSSDEEIELDSPHLSPPSSPEPESVPEPLGAAALQNYDSEEEDEELTSLLKPIDQTSTSQNPSPEPSPIFGSNLFNLFNLDVNPQPVHPDGTPLAPDVDPFSETPSPPSSISSSHSSRASTPESLEPAPLQTPAESERRTPESGARPSLRFGGITRYAQLTQTPIVEERRPVASSAQNFISHRHIHTRSSLIDIETGVSSRSEQRVIETGQRFVSSLHISNKNNFEPISTRELPIPPVSPHEEPASPPASPVPIRSQSPFMLRGMAPTRERLQRQLTLLQNIDLNALRTEVPLDVQGAAAPEVLMTEEQLTATIERLKSLPPADQDEELLEQTTYFLRQLNLLSAEVQDILPRESSEAEKAELRQKILVVIMNCSKFIDCVGTTAHQYSLIPSLKLALKQLRALKQKCETSLSSHSAQLHLSINLPRYTPLEESLSETPLEDIENIINRAMNNIRIRLDLNLDLGS